MGDCDLGEIRRRFGGRLALKGNLHTTQTMLMGSPLDVRREAIRAMLDAGESGGFVLSTGDQCGRDTPDENLFMLVETGREFGVYPLDLEAMRGELARLEQAPIAPRRP
jgi:uroporphyrinogen decarboxylase